MSLCHITAAEIKPLENNSRIHFRGKVVDMISEIVTLPNGQVLEIDKVSHPGGAAVVALDKAGNVCLLRQYRCVFDQWLWELPAGKIDNKEPPFDTVKRELQEEAGVLANQWHDLGYVISSPGVFTEKVYLYLARDLDQSAPSPESHEVMEIHWLPLQQAIDWCHTGEIVDAKTIAGLLRAQRYLETNLS